MKRIILSLMLSGFIAGCAAKKENVSASADAVATGGQTLAQVTPDLYSDGKSKVIKVADIRFQVNDRIKSKAAIVEAIRHYSGYIESSDLQLQNPLMEEAVTIRVLSEYFEDLLNEIGKQAVYTNYQKVSTDDVSKDFVDLESRLTTKREVQKRYEEILRRQTGTIEEVLKTEEQIGQLQEEIEATVSQMNHLKEKVRYSTINIAMYEVIKEPMTAAVAADPILPKFGRAFIAGWRALVEIFIGLAYVWPLLIAAVAGWLLLRRKLKPSA